MSQYIGIQLRALGPKEPPPALIISGQVYRRVRVFKHDFFAATALYARRGGRGPTPERLVLKLGRQKDFLGVPLAWLGEYLTERECGVLRHLAGVDRIPRVYARCGRSGFLYPYIPGTPLDERPALPDSFFSQLSELLGQVHSRHVAYLDLNKRGNILLGEDGRPWLIDFQIALAFGGAVGGLGHPTRAILGFLQREDLYHLGKHHRRFRPDLMTPGEIEQSRRVSPFIALHRFCTRPLTRVRRWVLAFLYRQDCLRAGDQGEVSPETDPRRWLSSR